MLSCWCVLGVAADWQYVVKPGDTLIGIADQHLQRQSNWRHLQDLNQVAEPRRLQPGERIRILLHLLRLEAASATVIHVRGRVSRHLDGAVRDVQVGDTLHAGEVLTTETESNVSQRCVDGSRLLVAERSRLIFSRLNQYRGTGMAETVIRLDEGDIGSRVEPQCRPGGRYRIESEALKLGVRGMRFRVEVAEDGTARSGVFNGSVAASSSLAGRSC